jgi:CHAT domain-containing protein
VYAPGETRGCSTFLWMLHEAEARGEPAVQALAYRMLSTLAADPPDPEEALVLAGQSLRYAEASGNADMIAEAFHQIGNVHSAAGRIDDAVAALHRAAMDHEQMFDPRDAHQALYEAGQLEVARNNLRAALADAELYQTRIRKHSTPKDRITAVLSIAEIHERLGNSEIARRFYEQARAMAREQHSPEWQLIAAYKIALQEIALGNARYAREVLEETRRLYASVHEPKLTVMNQTVLAAMQLDAGEVDGAEQTLDAALAVIAAKSIPAPNIAEVYVQRSRLRLAQGRPEEAVADARTAREKAGSPFAEALTAEGRALRMLSRDAAAEEVLYAAIELVEVELSQLPVDETGSGTILNTALGPYRELLDLLVKQGCARQALAVAERMRARSLRETLAHGRLDLSAGLDADKREQERKLERALADVNRRILATSGSAERAPLQQERDEARLALRRFRSELYAAHPRLDHRRPEAGSLPESIPKGELVLELAILDHAAFVFALRDDDVTVHRIAVSRQALERQIDAFVSALEQRNLRYAEPARRLYDLLLAPVAQQLGEATRLRIVPDGVSWRIPFHALVDRRGRHLAERMSVAYSPSLAMTRTAPAQPGTRRTLLAFGDPAIRTETAQLTRSLFRDASLGRLPDAASEARTIARLYEDANVRIGAEAREATFKDDAPAYRTLHLAAHSIIDDRAPMFSSIVLAASGNDPLEDGLLEAREIAGLDLHADLAVLSACETARGAVTAGEGVVGLSWAFLTAGVPTTVVSQWKVGSASTAELMIEFHRQLRAGRNAADALRAAMLELRRDPRWRHPFYWAPFAVIENSRISPDRQ